VHDDISQFIPIVLIGMVAALIIMAVVLRERARRQAFMDLARQYGFKYHRKSCGIPRQFAFLNALCQGHTRYASNILEGIYKERQILTFDYHYATGSGKDEVHHYLSVFMLQMERTFPELRIYPESFFSKIGQALGYRDIDFESVEFSDAFTVRSADKKFAYDICHVRMMEYLLENRKMAFEIEGQWLCTWRESRLNPEHVIPALEKLLEIRALMPKYLFEN